MTFKEIQDDIIKRTGVEVNDYCKFGCRSRTHAHVKERVVCKWKQRNSVRATFTLFHEIGHIETTKSSMRRAESEFYATQWAIDNIREYGVEIPESIRKAYQDYVDREKNRGIRRGGKGYAELKLVWE